MLFRSSYYKLEMISTAEYTGNVIDPTRKREIRCRDEKAQDGNTYYYDSCGFTQLRWRGPCGTLKFNYGFNVKRTNFTKRIQNTDFLCGKWREKRDSNPQPTVLETVALPIELFSRISIIGSIKRLGKHFQEMKLMSKPTLVYNISNVTSPNCLTSFADGKTLSRFHRDGLLQFYAHS